jgi:hypothetical protein
VTKAIWALLKDLRLEGAAEKLIVISLESFLVHFVVILPFLVVESCRDIFGALVGSTLGQLSRIWVEFRFKHCLSLIF